jgi:dihydroorotate dehydrogenase
MLQYRPFRRACRREPAAVSLYALARPFLFTLDAEAAHGAGLRAIELAYRSGMNPLLASRPKPLPTPAFGIDFPNPVGLAAGLDKNAAHVDALASLGFGFIEVGTITPRAQSGNPKPRMFRLPEHQAVINRLGFNNDGVDTLLKNLDGTRYTGVLGINIGRNKDTPNERAVDDYLHGLRAVHERATYVTVNISSPNTSGLRDLQEEETLRRFIGTLREAQEQLGANGRRKPMLLKIAPDLSETEMDAIASVLLASGIDGLICTNTTVARDAIQGHRHAAEAGGLSGAPVFAPSTAVLAGMSKRLGGKLPIVGVGGILSGADAQAKIAAGATLVQFYTGMIYRGPDLIGEAVEAIRQGRGF